MIPKCTKVETPASYGAIAPPGDQWPLNSHNLCEYAVNRIYPTIQGEGGQSGTPMTIIRLQGCPVGCLFCDTPESWAVPAQDSWKHAAEIAAIARQYPPEWALITGGEPTWHDLRALTDALREVGFRKALETSAVYEITGMWEWITVSPKPDGLLPVLATQLYLADEIKWVVGNMAQLENVEKTVNLWESDGLLGERVRISLQPMSTSKKATDLCMEALMQRPRWKLSLQIHKYLSIA